MLNIQLRIVINFLTAGIVWVGWLIGYSANFFFAYNEINWQIPFSILMLYKILEFQAF